MSNVLLYGRVAAAYVGSDGKCGRIAADIMSRSHGFSIRLRQRVNNRVYCGATRVINTVSAHVQCGRRGADRIDTSRRGGRVKILSS